MKDSDLWQTPKDFFNQLNNEFNFDYDVCCNSENKLAPTLGDYFTSDYKNCVCFMNPPYSNPTKFVKRAIELTKNNVITVCLLKSDTGTQLFHLLYEKYEIRFIKGRIRFTHPNRKCGNPNFPSMMVIIK